MVRRIALVLVVVALVVLALIAAIHTPMVQRGLCRRLEMLLTDQLDRPVTVRALRFSFLGAIHVEDFSIANPPEFPGLMLQVEDLSAALDLSALLHGRLSILKLTLEHPTFTYFQDAEGNDNMPAGGGESTTPKSDPRQGLETVFNKISAASAVIRDGVFRLELAREELNLTVSGIHIDIRGNASTNRYATAIDLRDIRFTLADILHLDGRITGMVEAGAGGCSSRGVKVSLQDEAVLLDIAAVELDDYFDPRLRIHARLTTSMEALEHIFHFDAPVKAALSMELILSGPPDSMAGTAVLEVDDARVDKLAVQHLRAEMEYREEHIRFTSLNAQTSGGMLKGVGDLDFGKEPGLSFDMNLENVDLAQVLASYEADVLADRMEWSGAGVFSLPDFDAARMSITGEVWHGLQGPKRTTRAGIPFAAHAPFRIDENSLSSSLISLQLPGGNIRIDSFRMGFDGPISAGIQADLVDMRKVAQTIAEQTKLLATLATTLPPISGQASLRGTVGGTLDAPALTGVLVLDTAAIDQFTVRTMRMPFNYSADSLAWDMTRIDLEAGGITTRGMLNLAAPGGRAFDTAMLPAGRLEIGSSGLQLAPIAHLLDIGPLSGELDLHITYDVSEAASAVQLDVQGKQISFDPIAADTVQIAAHLAEGEVIIDNASVGIGSGAVKFSGRIRSDASITAGGTIRDLDLARALVVEGLAVEGKVNGTAAVSGSLSAPTADLDLSLDTLAVAGLPLFNLAVEAELTAPEMLNLRIKSEAEELAAAIRIALSGDVPVDGSLTLRGIDVDPFLTAAGAESGTIVSKIDLDASITGFLADPSRL
ncbi:hypothetical protein JW905_13535, partial [bacterium]|nr:hypothetical protein [candidate division CSSED10-310 bacterium]